MSTTEQGRKAETLAARYIEARDLEVIDRNWRTRYAELDLVARGDDGIHIIEIKYRGNSSHGSGFDYITYDKQQRLIRGAASWCQQHRYAGPYQIDVISVIGDSDYPSIEWRQNVVEA